MPRTLRADVGDIVYHVLNRSTARLKIFTKDKDYQAFETTLEEAKEKYPMRILAYCIMPNHWHLVLYPEFDGQLVPFMRWLTMTHTHRWHAAHKTIGSGHLYQGRYKSFPVETDEHFLQLIRYVERNAKRARLVNKAEDWQWSSIHRRQFGKDQQKKLLTSWPVKADNDYLAWLNSPQPKEELETIRMSVVRGRPYGQEDWTHTMSERLGLQSAWRSRGRPRNI
jgi:putative transposase